MRRSLHWLLPLVFFSGCLADLELDTDGSDGDDASTELDPDSAAEETAAPTGPPVVEDPEAWAQQMATQRCAAFERCGCFTEGWSWFDAQRCIEDTVLFYELRAQWALQAGASLSPSCYAAQVSVLFEGACEDTVPPVSPLVAGEAASCKLFMGEATVDEPCTARLDPFANDDTCVEGLMCIGGRCAPVPEEGEACALNDSGVAKCTPPLLCIDDVCEARRVEGEACDPFTCALGSTCEDGVCVSARNPGAACETPIDCLSQRCVDGQCEPPAAALCGPYAFEVDIPPG